MIKSIHIFDLDGCVIDSLHRYKTLPCGQRIDLDYWILNCTRDKIQQDTFLPLYAHYHNCIRDKGAYVIIATSRQCTEHDLEFIKEHLAGYNKLIYRKQGETTKGWELKTRPIKPLLNLKQFKNAVINIYEDNLEQLEIMAKILHAETHYIPSQQGH